MHPHYSLAKISQELGVSKTTVSLTLSGKARQVGISEEQEKRILKFCRKVDYRPNIHAQRLNSRLAKNIGILLERVEDGATAQLLGGLVDDADQAGFRTTIKVFRPDQSESIIFDWLLTHEVDGVIYYGLELPAASLERIISENWPVIGIGVSPRLGIPVVNANNFTAGHTITENLIRHGFSLLLYLYCCHYNRILSGCKVLKSEIFVNLCRIFAEVPNYRRAASSFSFSAARTLVTTASESVSVRVRSSARSSREKAMLFLPSGTPGPR